MIKTMMSIISNPKSIFLNIRNKKSTVFFYILFLTLILSLPLFITSLVNKELIFVKAEDINSKVNVLIDKNIKIENYELINEDNLNLYFVIDAYIFAIGDPVINDIGYIFNLGKDGVETSLSIGQGLFMNVNKVSYESLLDSESLEFNLENKSLVTYLFINAFTSNKTLITSKIFAEFTNNLFDIVTIAFIFTIIASIARKIPLKFGQHFKVSVYVTTIYTLSYLILILFNLRGLSFIAIIVTYIYHFIIYNSVRIIKREKGDSDE